MSDGGSKGYISSKASHKESDKREDDENEKNVIGHKDSDEK